MNLRLLKSNIEEDKMYFQDLMMNLLNYWKDKGCLVMEPYDVEKGAGTMNPHTFLRSLGPEPWRDRKSVV